MFITYIFAIFGMAGITKGIYEQQQAVRDDTVRYAELDELMKYVGGLDLLMITLIQLLTLDSWNGILRSLMEEVPFCWVYFYAYIAVSVFVLMNLVTAIIVNNALDNAKVDENHAIKERELAKKQELKGLEELFSKMDSDGSGTINWDEFKQAFADEEMSKKWKLLDFEPEECKEVFNLFDDGDGEIETAEFFKGLGKMKGQAQSKDIFRLQKTVTSLLDIVHDVQKNVLSQSRARLHKKLGPATPKSNDRIECKPSTPRMRSEETSIHYHSSQLRQDNTHAEHGVC
jgi:Ca2+-binding EF-hand superfamily protein